MMTNEQQTEVRETEMDMDMDIRYEIMEQEMNEIKEIMLLNGAVGSALTVLLAFRCWDFFQTGNEDSLVLLILLSIGLACVSAFSLKQGIFYHQILHALKREDYKTVDDWIRTQTTRKKR